MATTSVNPKIADFIASATTSGVWQHHVRAPDTPDGFTVRTGYPGNADGCEVMLERWQAGSAEPPHSHPGDDMTVVVAGRMAIQFFKRGAGGLVAVGEPLILKQGDTGYIKAGAIHDAKYLEDCKLVYVHERAFGFNEEL
jgi:quercetin dioxygenase-like cupin family protein